MLSCRHTKNMSSDSRLARLSSLPVFVFPVVAIVLSWATSSVHDEIGVANIALSLAIITVTAGFLRWDSGIITSVVAAGSLTFFHTEPVHSLRITSSSDITMVILLILLGLGVSALTASRIRHSLRGFVVDSTTSQKSALKDELLSSTSIANAWTHAIGAFGDEISAADVQLTDNAPSHLPVISRRPSGLQHSDEPFVLPETGAVAYFADPRITHALVVTPRQGMGAISVNRDALFAFIQHIELALR